ncbi:MAG TPA: hypothetical protein VFR93_06635 [Candidatus Limnocylindrales bacterium]|nr:hypothetical protein [Candidatus Limnocylindrales bacterium]
MTWGGRSTADDPLGRDDAADSYRGQGPEPDPWRDRGNGRWSPATERPARSAPARRRLVTPTRVILAVAALGSIAFLAYAVTVRDTRQIPLLASGAVVLGLVFAALAAAGGIATYRAGRDGRVLQATALALGGGIAGIVAAGAMAFALVIVLAYRA